MNVSQQIPVPVKFVMKGMNAVFGSHFDHYWIEYESFTDEKPDPTVFAVEGTFQLGDKLGEFVAKCKFLKSERQFEQLNFHMKALQYAVWTDSKKFIEVHNEIAYLTLFCLEKLNKCSKCTSS